MFVQIDYFGLNPYEAEMMKLLQEGRGSEITGAKLMSKVSENIYVKQEFTANEESVHK